MSSYKATEEQWLRVENKLPGDTRDHLCALACGMRELRARVEALEADTKPTPNPSQIRSSLLTAVSEAVCAMADCGDTPSNWQPEARAAIYAVAEWLDGQAGGTRAAWMIRQGLNP